MNDTEYSADYPCFLTRRLREQLSADLFVHFLQAPCCEVNHIDVSHDRPQEGYAWAEHVGKTLANDRLGYIPPKRMFDEGNYEAVVAKIDRGQGEFLVMEAVTLLHELKRQ